MILKILGILPIAGSSVIVPLLVRRETQGVELDRGKFHLGRGWKDCVNLLEEISYQNRENNKKIYLCKLDHYSNKLEMIYYDSKGGVQGEVVDKIHSLRQSSQGTYGHSSKLILKLEKNWREETLERPTMLFDYVGGGNYDEKNLLFPDKQCSISKQEGNTYNFSCESTSWKVIKPKFSLL